MLEDDAVFEPGRRVVLSGPGDVRAGCNTEIEFFRRQHGRCVVKFRGIDSISEGEKHIGKEVKILAEDLPDPKEGWFYTFQLRGCQVFSTSGEYLGLVMDVLGSGGNEILKVDHDNREILIPFAEPYLKRIDPAQHRIEVDLPEDLRDLNK